MAGATPDGAGPGSVGDAAGRPRLVHWVRPTRGYVVAACATGVVIALAGVGWQVWLLSSSPGPRPAATMGVSLTSIAVLIAGAVVMGWGARLPRPHVLGDDPGRAQDRSQRRAVRRASWRAQPPADPRLAVVAARSLAGRDSTRTIAAFWILFAGLMLGVDATRDVAEPPTSMPSLGMVWSSGALVMLLVAGLVRWRLRRLDAAWRHPRSR